MCRQPMLDHSWPSNQQRPNTAAPASSNGDSHLALGGAPAPPRHGPSAFRQIRKWIAQRDSIHDWPRLHECSDRIRSPGSLWTILHKTPIPNGATWGSLIAVQKGQALSLGTLDGWSILTQSKTSSRNNAFEGGWMQGKYFSPRNT